MRISSIEANIFNVNEAEVTIIKNKSNNLLLNSSFMPYGMR